MIRTCVRALMAVSLISSLVVPARALDRSPPPIGLGPGSTAWGKLNCAPGRPCDVGDLQTTSPDGTAIARSLTTRLRDLPIMPQDYWTGPPSQFCDGLTDVSSAYQAAAAVSRNTGRPLHLGGVQGKACVFGSTVTLNGPLNLIGDGEEVCTITGVFNGPIFLWDFGTAGGEEFSMRGCTLSAFFAQNVDYSLSRAVKFVGSGFIQFGRFSDLTIQSLYAGFENSTGLYSSSFGQGSYLNWMTFDRITLRGGARPIKYGWFYPNSSGTGSTYTNIKSVPGLSGAVLRFEAKSLNPSDRVNVGDIVVGGGHFGGDNASVISVGPNTDYRANISITGSQLDAGMLHPFDFDGTSTGVQFSRIRYSGNNTGGDVDVGGNLPPLINSVIEDQLISEAVSAKFWQGNLSAAGSGNFSTIPVLAVSLGATQAPSTAGLWNGTLCTLSASGLMGGAGAMVSAAKYAITYNNGTVTPLQLGATDKSPAGLDFTFSVSGGVTTFSLAFPGTASGTSYADTQIKCVGGAIAIKQL